MPFYPKPKDALSHAQGKKMIKAANTLIQNAFSLREHLRTLIHQADRKHQPRTQVEITVFGPDDRRAIRMEMRKCRVGNP